MWWLIGVGGLILCVSLINWCYRRIRKNYYHNESDKKTIEPRMHTHDHGGFFQERNQHR
ncbi:hypothetical protein GCM10008967_37240 [Bacillus carboniphilus]|uniref:Uncharacterized protein n=1 Tax=Bacillus carboniphilus TaxID=86663 RepID=A0ABN0WPD3_9BACI